jgi:hypothetical protein
MEATTFCRNRIAQLQPKSRRQSCLQPGGFLRNSCFAEAELVGPTRGAAWIGFHVRAVIAMAAALVLALRVEPTKELMGDFRTNVIEYDRKCLTSGVD